MSVVPGPHPQESQLRFLRDMIADNAVISGDVAEIGARAFAIHGMIAVDGDVIMANFDSYEAARLVLDLLPVPEARLGVGAPVGRRR